MTGLASDVHPTPPVSVLREAEPLRLHSQAEPGDERRRDRWERGEG
ncbi:hypothetical protein F7734_17790 [Scytonema sp. UIC 10036]|nr:hypothetical protein [Scytonema sp. UIC 10036]MUG94140.1 hypothetical protein [Scytonema sp. UIC 10036]